jgi:NitT/TauT family transport system permease protein
VSSLFAARRDISTRANFVLALLSFLVPLSIWSAVSYVPWIWHPKIEIENPGDLDYATQGMLVDREVFAAETQRLESQGLQPPTGERANPIYLPAPHQVARALVTAFQSEPRRRNEPWFHQTLWHSIQIIFWGFTLSSILGVPLGILAGTYAFFARLTEPVVEFVRYMPAPVFGALCVAILGIHDAPKIAIIFIGTFFQQVLVIANSTRQLDPALIEAAQTLGAKRTSLITHVVVPGVVSRIYSDQRILLGWAWTYLIVAELIGTSTGITWFITQQARYNNYDNVYAAIIIIGVIGLSMDLALAWLGRRIFPWEPHREEGALATLRKALWRPGRTRFPTPTHRLAHGATTEI